MVSIRSAPRKVPGEVTSVGVPALEILFGIFIAEMLGVLVVLDSRVIVVFLGILVFYAFWGLRFIDPTYGVFDTAKVGYSTDWIPSRWSGERPSRFRDRSPPTWQDII